MLHARLYSEFHQKETEKYSVAYLLMKMIDLLILASKIKKGKRWMVLGCDCIEDEIAIERCYLTERTSRSHYVLTRCYNETLNDFLF